MHVDDDEVTTASMIAELPDRWSRRVARMLIGSPCENEYRVYEL